MKWLCTEFAHGESSPAISYAHKKKLMNCLLCQEHEQTMDCVTRQKLLEQ